MIVPGSVAHQSKKLTTELYTEKWLLWQTSCYFYPQLKALPAFSCQPSKEEALLQQGHNVLTFSQLPSQTDLLRFYMFTFQLLFK